MKTESTRRSHLRLVALAFTAGFGLLGGADTASAQGNYGTIKGKLVWGGATVPEPKVEYKKNDPTAKDPEVCAVEPILNRDLLVDPATKGISNGFAYLLRPSGKNPEAEQALVAKEAEVVIDQKNCQFIPYSTAIFQKQDVIFKSSDPVNHNVRYSAFANQPFNRILPPNGKDKVKLVAERRPLPLACDIHPWMKGFMMVFDHPFFAVTKDDGSFEITGVPAGAQKLIVWHSTKGYVNEGKQTGLAVTVKAGGVTDVGEIKVGP